MPHALRYRSGQGSPHPRRVGLRFAAVLKLLPEQSVDRVRTAAADGEDEAYRPDEQYIFVAAVRLSRLVADPAGPVSAIIAA